MRYYSIKDLEQLSGIKSHTLRVWEQRYNLLAPKRTETNIRYYENEDLKLILNVALLNDNGYKISKIARMSSDEIKKEVLTLTDKSLTYGDQIHALIISMVELDEERFEKIISTNILRMGFEMTMLQIICPFFSKIGILWQTGNIHPGQEHFVSNLVRQKLIVAIDGQIYSGGGKKFLLFLPQGELHEISLLFSCYLLKSHGHKVLYLGQDTPDEDVNAVSEIHRPDYLLTVVTSSPAAEHVQRYLNSLSERFPASRILISGYQVLSQDLKIPSNMKVMQRLEDIKDYLTTLTNVA
ncbi:MerR family transcriptional regulator [Negadavirga shengliensis]|uniref:MerR family transcriptional regulator n=1 Tax=Negadavirga shengliensis TaxID=1389218 RepID=A0ABV9SVZ3_9BACT